MKKVIAIFAMAAVLVACGGKTSNEGAQTDSTAVAADTTAVTDSVAPTAADSSVVK